MTRNQIIHELNELLHDESDVVKGSALHSSVALLGHDRMLDETIKSSLIELAQNPDQSMDKAFSQTLGKIVVTLKRMSYHIIYNIIYHIMSILFVVISYDMINLILNLSHNLLLFVLFRIISYHMVSGFEDRRTVLQCIL